VQPGVVLDLGPANEEEDEEALYVPGPPDGPWKGCMVGKLGKDGICI